MVPSEHETIEIVALDDLRIDRCNVPDTETRKDHADGRPRATSADDDCMRAPESKLTALAKRRNVRGVSTEIIATIAAAVWH